MRVPAMRAVARPPPSTRYGPRPSAGASSPNPELEGMGAHFWDNSHHLPDVPSSVSLVRTVLARVRRSGLRLAPTSFQAWIGDSKRASRLPGFAAPALQGIRSRPASGEAYYGDRHAHSHALGRGGPVDTILEQLVAGQTSQGPASGGDDTKAATSSAGKTPSNRPCVFGNQNGGDPRCRSINITQMNIYARHIGTLGHAVNPAGDDCPNKRRCLADCHPRCITHRRQGKYWCTKCCNLEGKGDAQNLEFMDWDEYCQHTGCMARREGDELSLADDAVLALHESRKDMRATDAGFASCKDCNATNAEKDYGKTPKTKRSGSKLASRSGSKKPRTEASEIVDEMSDEENGATARIRQLEKKVLNLEEELKGVKRQRDQLRSEADQLKSGSHPPALEQILEQARRDLKFDRQKLDLERQNIDMERLILGQMRQDIERNRQDLVRSRNDLEQSRDDLTQLRQKLDEDQKSLAQRELELQSKYPFMSDFNMNLALESDGAGNGAGFTGI